MHVEKVFITCSIRHHIVCDVCAHVYSAVATACSWIHKDCLCRAWDDTVDSEGQCSS